MPAYTCSVRVAADGEGVASELRVLQDDVHQQRAQHSRSRARRARPAVAFAEIRISFRDVVNGQAVGDDQRQAADDAQRAERDDERIDASVAW